MLVKRVPVLVRFLPLISALASTMGVAQQPRTWPDDIESLLFEYLSNLPGRRCLPLRCIALNTAAWLSSSGPLTERRSWAMKNFRR